MTAPPVLAFIYDRCATSNQAMLDLRLAACTEHLAERGWDVGGQYVDNGNDALTDNARPAFDRMLRGMAEVTGRDRVCLVYDWGRLSHDSSHRQEFAHAVLGAGGWLSTIDGESVRFGATPTGRLTAGPVIA
ncbi:recombinase family protein [Streptomyces griseoluteus]|uniref:recombinase family protein n=1 Tax=Streptomyces griseoluteus TaxID=29306 RepID=UPI0033D241D5